MPAMLPGLTPLMVLLSMTELVRWPPPIQTVLQLLKLFHNTLIVSAFHTLIPIDPRFLNVSPSNVTLLMPPEPMLMPPTPPPSTTGISPAYDIHVSPLSDGLNCHVE